MKQVTFFVMASLVITSSFLSAQPQNNNQQVYTQWTNGPFLADGTPANAQPAMPQQSGNARANINPSMNAAISSEAVTHRVRTALKNDPSLSNSARNAQVTVNDGKVTLSGVAITEAEKSKVEAIVRQVNGVKTVINHLIVPSTPSTPK